MSRTDEEETENQMKGSWFASVYSTECFPHRILLLIQRKRVYDEKKVKEVLIDHTQRKVRIQHKITSVYKSRLVTFKSWVQVTAETGIEFTIHRTMEKWKRESYSILRR